MFLCNVALLFYLVAEKWHRWWMTSTGISPWSWVLLQNQTGEGAGGNGLHRLNMGNTMSKVLSSSGLQMPICAGMQNWLGVQRESVRAAISLPLSVWYTLSKAFSNDDSLCLPLEGRGVAASGLCSTEVSVRQLPLFCTSILILVLILWFSLEYAQVELLKVGQDLKGYCLIHALPWLA